MLVNKNHLFYNLVVFLFCSLSLFFLLKRLIKSLNMPEETEINNGITENKTVETTELIKENVIVSEKEIKTYKCVTLGAFGGSKHIRIDMNEMKSVGKNEVAIDVQAW